MSRTEYGNMLLSVMVELRVAAPTIILGPLGIPVRSWFLDQIKSVDRVYATELHDSNGIKPYTVSTLLDDNGYPLGPGRKLEPGSRCWLRITSFGDYLSYLLLKKVVKAIKEKIKSISIYKMEFLVYDCTINPFDHPLAQKTSFTEIAQAVKHVNPTHEMRLHFQSPTAFSSQDLDVPLPIPGNIFKNYYERWNKFCLNELMQIEDTWPDFVKSHIMVDQFSSIQTNEWIVPGDRQNQKAIGFEGVVNFKLLRKQKLRYDPEFWKDTFVVLQSLAEFSFYCGTGQHTTVGMGQTAIVSSLIQPNLSVIHSQKKRQYGSP